MMQNCQQNSELFQLVETTFCTLLRQTKHVPRGALIQDREMWKFDLRNFVPKWQDCEPDCVKF